MILFYIPCKNKKEAEKIAKGLIKKNLVACMNAFPISSMYEWKGKLVNGKEHLLLLKTANKNAKKVQDAVEKMHSYDIPCIMKIKAEANKKFERWIDENSC